MACICMHSSDLRCLSSSPETGRSYSVVVLDRSQAPPSSPSLFCTRMLGRACERGYISLGDYLSSCMSSTPCFLFCPGLTQPLSFLLCIFNSAARCDIRFYAVSLSGSSVVCGVLRVTSRTRLCHIDGPQSFTLNQLPYSSKFSPGVNFRLFRHASQVAKIKPVKI